MNMWKVKGYGGLFRVLAGVGQETILATANIARPGYWFFSRGFGSLNRASLVGDT